MKDRIIVSLTTWKKRDKDVVIMLEHFQNQTVKPDEIILWLSELEYSGVIPQHLQDCLDNGYLTKIRFVSGNTKCYKKWEVFKEYDGKNDYVILLDDDYYYPDDCIESLYNSAKKHKCPCCYYEKTFDYVNDSRVEIAFEQSSLKNQLYPGFCCIPPGLISHTCELFNNDYVILRDRYNPISDDLWFGIWFKKKGIPIYGIHKWDKSEIIDTVIKDTQKDSLWECENRKPINGVRQVVRNFATVVEVTDSIEFVKNLYPNFDIEKCSDKRKIDNDYENSVSVIMTAYGTKKYIKQAIDSVYSQSFFKNHDKWELLIGVDGCQDTMNYLKTIMWRYDEHLRVFMMDDNKGTYVTSNTLLKLSKYNWILRFDSDDVMKTDMVSTLINQSKNYDCCVYRYSVTDESVKQIKTKLSNIYANGSIFVKRSVINQLGGYKPWPVSADAELVFCRICKFFKVKHIEDPLFYYRIHRSSLTHDSQTNGRSEVRKKYNSIWKNEDIPSLKEAVIECVTNTYTEIFTDPQLPRINIEELFVNQLFTGKVVMYTCVLDGRPEEIRHTDSKFDYVCFSDHMFESNTWKVRLIPEELRTLSPTKQKEMIKICPHKYLPEYDYSIWVENDYVVNESLLELCDFEMSPNKFIYMKGNECGCVYKRISKYYKQKLDNQYTLRMLAFKYQRDGYPVNNGLVDTSIIIRKHNTDYCKRLMELWIDEVLGGSSIDCLSFNYCLWKVGSEGFDYIKIDY